MALPDYDLGSDVGSMDGEARLDREESRKRWVKGLAGCRQPFSDRHGRAASFFTPPHSCPSLK
jgi:hypothetical protein